MAGTQFTGPEICAKHAHEVVAMLKAGEVSPADLIDAALSRIAKVEPVVNATVTLCEERARAAVLDPAQADHPGWLAGLPLGIKDLTPVEGVRTTWGSLGFRDFVPEDSHPLVKRLESRGGVVLGKTNTPEMGAGANTFNAVFGRTRNPWDTSRNAGGSSGGAAVSLATGELWLSHGSDLAGSLRTPAAFCGVVGFRPSPGLVSPGPAGNRFHPEAVQGPMARSVRDCALFLDAMAGFDPAWAISFPPPEEPYQQAVLRADEKVRIAFSPLLAASRAARQRWKATCAARWRRWPAPVAWWRKTARSFRASTTPIAPCAGCCGPAEPAGRPSISSAISSRLWRRTSSRGVT